MKEGIFCLIRNIRIYSKETLLSFLISMSIRKHKHKILLGFLCIIAWFLAIVLTYQKSETYARSSNADYLDAWFWATNPNDNQIIDALYGLSTTTAYTENRATDICDTGIMTVKQLYPGLDTIPQTINTWNTIYVLHPWTYTSTLIPWPNTNYQRDIITDCVAFVGSGDIGDIVLQETELSWFKSSGNVYNLMFDNITLLGENANIWGLQTLDSSTFHNITVEWGGIDIGIGWFKFSNITFDTIVAQNIITSTSPIIRMLVWENILVNNMNVNGNSLTQWGVVIPIWANIKIQNSLIESTLAAILMPLGWNIDIEQNTFRNNSQIDIFHGSGGDMILSWNTHSGSFIWVVISNIDSGSIYDNSFQNMWINAINMSGNVNNITVDSNTINGVSSQTWSAIYIYDGSNIQITSGELYNLSNNGIYIDSGINIDIEEQYIHSFTNNEFTWAIVGIDSQNITISDSTLIWPLLQDNNGIFIQNGRNILSDRNVVQNFEAWHERHRVTSGTIQYGTSIQNDFHIELITGTNINVLSSIIDLWTVGIMGWDSDNHVIENNTITNLTSWASTIVNGIRYLWNNENILIRNNTLQNIWPGLGIALIPSTQQNIYNIATNINNITIEWNVIENIYSTISDPIGIGIWLRLLNGWSNISNISMSGNDLNDTEGGIAIWDLDNSLTSTIDNINITNTTINNTANFGITANNATNLTMDNITITNLGGVVPSFITWLQSSPIFWILNNILSGGVALYNTDDVIADEIMIDTFSGNGIFIEQNNNNTFTNIDITNGQNGFVFATGSNSNTIDTIEVSNTTYGIYSPAKDTNITNNNIYNSSLHNNNEAIYVTNFSRWLIQHTTVFDNTWGIYINEPGWYNIIEYAELFNNNIYNIGLAGDHNEYNLINNVISYNSSYGLFAMGLNSINNSLFFNNENWIMMEYQNNVYRTNIFNNNQGLILLWPGNHFVDTSIYNNNIGIDIMGGTWSSYNGLSMFANTNNFNGTNGADSALQSAVRRAFPTLPNDVNNTWSMRCYHAVQAENIGGSTLLNYPYCDSRGIQSWSWDNQSIYTYFEGIPLQEETITLTTLTTVTNDSGSFNLSMHLADRYYSGGIVFGWQATTTNESPSISDSGGIIVRDANGPFDIQAINMSGWNPSSIAVDIFDVNNGSFDGWLAPFTNIMNFDTEILPWFNRWWPGPFVISRLQYTNNNPVSTSNYYGIIRNIAGTQCGNGNIEAASGEQCDDGNTQNGDGCSDTCQLETPQCEIIALGTNDGLAPFTFNFDVTYDSGWTNITEIYYGDGSTGTNESHTYTNSWVYNITVNTENTTPGTEESTSSCFYASVTVSAGICGNGIVDPGETCDDSNTTGNDWCNAQCQIESCQLMIQPDFQITRVTTWEFNGIFSWTTYSGIDYIQTLMLEDTSTSVNPIVDYEWNIYSSGTWFGFGSSPYTFDNSLISTGQWTESITLDFSATPISWPVFWVTLTVTDSQWYEATYHSIAMKEDEEFLEFAANSITDFTISWDNLNATGDILSTYTRSGAIVNTPGSWSLYFQYIWNPSRYGIDRTNNNSNEIYTTYPWVRTASNIYPFNIQYTTRVGTYLDRWTGNTELSYRTYPVNCSMCGNNIIDAWESCDDGNIQDGDGCNSICDLETRSCSRFTGMTSTWYAPHDVSLSIQTNIYTGEYIFEDIQRWNGSTGDMFTNNNYTYTNNWIYTWSIVIDNSIDRMPPITCEFPIEVETVQVCGNSIVEWTEECDDGWTQNGNWCDSSCDLETRSCSRFTGMTSTWYAPHDVSLWVIPGIYTGGLNFFLLQRWDWSTGNLRTNNTHTYINTGNYLASIRVRPTIPNANATSATQIICEFPIDISQQNFCGNGTLDLQEGEVCDDGNNTNGDWCTDQCQLETIACSLVATPTSGETPLTVNFGFNPWWATTRWINYGDGMTWQIQQYTYTDTGTYNPVAYILNPLDQQTIQACPWYITIDVSPNIPVQPFCGDGIVNGNDECDLWWQNWQPNWCSQSCELEQFSCNIRATNTSGSLPLTVNFGYNRNPWEGYIDYGDGTTGTSLTHIYTQTGSYTITGYAYHPWNQNVTVTCNLNETINVQDGWNQNTCQLPFTYSFDGDFNQYIEQNGAWNTHITYTGNQFFTWAYSVIYTIYTGDMSMLSWQIYDEITINDMMNSYSGYIVSWVGTSWLSWSIQTTTGILYSGTFIPNLVYHGTWFSSGFEYTHTITGYVIGTWSYIILAQVRENWGDNEPALCDYNIFTGDFIQPICGNDIREPGEECDGWSSCTNQCTIEETSGWGGWWWGGGGWSLSQDYCPDGDFSTSYYDKTCWVEQVHSSPEPIGKACRYDDEEYLANGPFTDTTNHRWYPYAEIMRVSCMHRGRWVWQGLWIYEPNSNILKSEVLKTVVKILWVAFEDFDIETENIVYNGPTPFADVPKEHRFAHYANYAYTVWLTDGLTTTKDGKPYINPDEDITRYEAIQLIMTAYNMINNINIQNVNNEESSVLWDMIDANNPYYQYVRQAEMFGFISWVPQVDGSYNFEWQRYITRSELAKIVSVPFTEQLFNLDEVVLNSQLYKIVVQAINQTEGDKFVFINTLVQKLQAIDDYKFIMDFKIQKELFLEKLEELLIKPLVEEAMLENS